MTNVIQALFAANEGRTVEANNDQNKGIFKVAKLADKIGTMKNGDKAEYVVLTNKNDEAVVIMLHPNVAKKLFEKGEDTNTGYKMVAVEEAQTESEYQADVNRLAATMTAEDSAKIAEREANPVPINATAEVILATDAGEVLATVPAGATEQASAETASEDNGATAEATGETAPEEPKEPSKKDLTIAIVHAGWDAKKARKDIIKEMIDKIGMSGPCANTYYQNVRSGTWGGRKGPGRA